MIIHHCRQMADSELSENVQDNKSHIVVLELQIQKGADLLFNTKVQLHTGVYF